MKCRLLSIGDRVGEGFCVPHSRFRQVVNFVNGNRLVSLVDSAVGAGPVNIIIDGLDSTSAQTLEVTGDSVVVNGIPFAFSPAQVYDSSMNFCAGREIPRQNIFHLKNLLLEQAPEKSMAFLLDPERKKNFRPGFEAAVCDQLQQGADLYFSGAIEAGVAKLHGCGFGLTPSGDDFIAGVLVALHVMGEKSRALKDRIFRCAPGGSLLVSSFLALAHEGRINDLMRSLLESLLNKEQDKLTNAAVKYFAVGATSGADLCTGLVAVLERGL